MAKEYCLCKKVNGCFGRASVDYFNQSLMKYGMPMAEQIICDTCKKEITEESPDHHGFFLGSSTTLKGAE